jgi:hypothetical protein
LLRFFREASSVRVRLIKKFAERIDGVDLRAHAPGDTINLARSEARLLLAEGWAVAENSRVNERHERRQMSSSTHRGAIAADRS